MSKLTNTPASDLQPVAPKTAAPAAAGAAQRAKVMGKKFPKDLPDGLNADPIASEDVILAQAGNATPAPGASAGAVDSSMANASATPAAEGGAAAKAASVATPELSAASAGFGAIGAIGAGIGLAALLPSGEKSKSTPGNTINGVITAGPVVADNQLYVQLYQKDGVTKIGGETKVGANGSFSVDVGTYTGGVIAKVVDKGTGNDYMDESIGAKDLMPRSQPLPWWVLAPTRSTSPR